MARRPRYRRLVVVGGGMAGLAAARSALDLVPHLDVHVLERERRIGGLVESEQAGEGFTLEYGARLRGAEPADVESLRRSGFEGALRSFHAKEKTAYVARGGKLVPLPAGLAFGVPTRARDVVTSGALSLGAKLRVALEPLVAPRDDDVDESVAAFVTRRLGKAFLDEVVGPVLKAVHGVPPEELSARVCLPRLLELERERGRVTMGVGDPAAWSSLPPVLSLQSGMEALAQTLAHDLWQRIHTGVEVQRIERGAQRRYRIRLSDGGMLETDAVILAVPAHVAIGMIERLAPQLAELLAQVRYSRLDALTLAFSRESLPRELSRSGFAVPGMEMAGRTLRACAWSSVKWLGHAPDSNVRMRCVLAAPGASDAELFATARTELAEVMGVTAAPTLVRTRRIARALPIQDVGCDERRERMHERAEQLGSFALAGNAHGGVGVAECLESGRKAAERVVRELVGVERV